jgi:hypothetical protein
MATAWAEQGKVVVRKPTESVYGIELSAPKTAAPVQVRVIAGGTQGRSKQRDNEVEEAWCAEFGRLRSMLGDAGFATSLAVANPPGKVPIKEMPANVTSRQARRQEARQPGL